MMNKKGATSLQRILILVIILDIFLIMVFNFSYGNIANNDNVASDSISKYGNFSRDFSNRFDTETDDEDRLQLNPSHGDPKAGGRAIWEIFNEGIGSGGLRDSDNCLGSDCGFTYIYWVIFGFWLFMGIIHTLLGLEIYFMFINRKYT